MQFLCADPFTFLKELQAPGKRQLECSALSALWENLEIEAELQKGESDSLSLEGGGVGWSTGSFPPWCLCSGETLKGACEGGGRHSRQGWFVERLGEEPAGKPADLVHKDGLDSPSEQKEGLARVQR